MPPGEPSEEEKYKQKVMLEELHDHLSDVQVLARSTGSALFQSYARR